MELKTDPKIYRGAADYLNTFGWVKGHYAKGDRVCLVTSLNRQLGTYASDNLPLDVLQAVYAEMWKKRSSFRRLALSHFSGSSLHTPFDAYRIQQLLIAYNDHRLIRGKKVLTEVFNSIAEAQEPVWEFQLKSKLMIQVTNLEQKIAEQDALIRKLEAENTHLRKKMWNMMFGPNITKEREELRALNEEFAKLQDGLLI